MTIRLLMLFECATFIAAALVHSGFLIAGYEHGAARIAESVIAAVLLVGVAASWIWPARTPAAGLAAQGFALVGTLVGVFTIAIGVGPRTPPDIAFHIAILAILAWGLAVARSS